MYRHYWQSTTLLFTVFSIPSFFTTSYADENVDQLQNHKPEYSSTPPVEEVHILGNKRGDFTIITENTQKLVDVPGALGDPLAAVLSLPGVVAIDGGEPAVRGSSPADNLYLVDFIPAGYVFHEFSQSVFSEFILQDFKLHSAGFGPSYSNVTGAAFDITLRDPRNQDFGGVVDLSLLRSGIFLESRVTENSAFYLSARQSMIHLVVKEQTEEDAREEGEGIRIIDPPQDRDYQFKYAWNINDNHQLSFSANGASDQVEAELSRELDFVASNPDFAGDAKINNAFDGQSVNYKFTVNDNFIGQLAIGHSDEDEKTFWGQGYHSFLTTNNKLVKGELNYQLSEKHNITLGSLINSSEFGLDYEGIILVCTEFDADCASSRRVDIDIDESLTVKEKSLYLNDNWELTDRFWLDIGAQWYNNDFTDERLTLPRSTLGFDLNTHTTFKLKYGHYARLPELDSSFPGIGNPNLLTQKAKHSVIGVQKQLNQGWSWNAEFYYKTLDDLPLAITDNEDDDSYYINAVEGTAMGLDVLINKDITDKWYGWLALSLGKSERTNILTNETKDYFLDTPWMVSWVMKYLIKDNMEIGWRWNLRSGVAYTPITGVRENPVFEDSVLPIYGNPFSERLPSYSRLDVRYRWDFTLWGLDSALIVDVLNALNQENITERSLDYDNVESPGDEPITTDEAEIGITPAIGLRIHF